jgi:hypothetical protein
MQHHFNPRAHAVLRRYMAHNTFLHDFVFHTFVFDHLPSIESFYLILCVIRIIQTCVRLLIIDKVNIKHQIYLLFILFLKEF